MPSTVASTIALPKLSKCEGETKRSACAIAVRFRMSRAVDGESAGQSGACRDALRLQVDGSGVDELNSERAVALPGHQVWSRHPY